MGYMKRNCDHCDKEYEADERNLKRGWGLCCSKSCAASKREKSKLGYNSERVAANNIRRENWTKKGAIEGDSVYHVDLSLGEDDMGWDAHKDTF